MQTPIQSRSRLVVPLCFAALALPACLGGVQLRSIKSFSALEYGVPEKYVTVGGVKLCYTEQGRGDEVVVLLSPSLAHLNIWKDLAQELAKKARVIALDLPGAGKSDKPPRFRYEPKVFAEVVRRFLDQIGVRSATLVGNSNGGATALAVALQEPAKVRRLVLLAAPGGQRLPAWKRRGSKWLMDSNNMRANPYTTRFVLNSTAFGQVNARTEAFISDQLAIRGAGEEYEAWLRAQQKTVINAGRFDASARLKEIKAPTLLLWGEKDRVVPRAQGEALRAGIAGAELVVLPGLGHMPEIESPDATARLIDGFLARTKPSAASTAPVPAQGSGSKKDDDDDKEEKEEKE